MVCTVRFKMLLLTGLLLALLPARNDAGEEQPYEKYSREVNEFESQILQNVRAAVEGHVECKQEGCGCHTDVIHSDLSVFKDTGVTEEMFQRAASQATKYQIISGKLYREVACHFPTRCAGVEHYLAALASALPDLELALNTRDWPQLNSAWGHRPAPVFSFSKVACHFPTRCAGVEHYLAALASALPDLELALNTRDWPQLNSAWGHRPAPVFSFSKTPEYYDIMYPAWSFWEGGPAIGLYPGGIGRWHRHRSTISAAARQWPWEKKEAKAFFRGSRTSEERDALILLSRSHPDLVDAQYTKNQAWKSDADTLHAPAAAEVSFEEHCRYKYLFNYRGVAASFRLKHLFLCRSLVFHVGDRWREFFYPSLVPWLHYVPVEPAATRDQLLRYVRFFREHDALASEIAERGAAHVWRHLRERDVHCYWRSLLQEYAKLLTYPVLRDPNLIEITIKS